MRRLFYLTIACFLLMGGMAAQAAEIPPAKIGVVDIQTIVTDSDPAKAAKEQLDQKYGKEKDALEKQRDDLQKKAEALKNPKVSDERKAAFIRDRQKLEQDTRSFVRKLEQDEAKLKQDLVTLIFSAAYEVAQAKGFTFIVDVSGGGVLYADQSMDITQDVLAEINKIFASKKEAAPAKAPDQSGGAKK